MCDSVVVGEGAKSTSPIVDDVYLNFHKPPECLVKKKLKCSRAIKTKMSGGSSYISYLIYSRHQW